MQKVIIKLLLMLTIFNLNAQTYTFNASENITKKLNIINSSMWAINGGIFQTIKNGIKIPYSGNYQLLIKDNENNLMAYAITIESKIVDTNHFDKLNTIKIDTTAPEILFTWSNSIKNDKGYIVGKDSKVSWETRDSDQIKVFINDNETTSTNETLSFSDGDYKLKIEAQDYYENKSKKVINLTTDFQAPEVIWKLLPPAKYVNNHWVAGDSATVHLTSSDKSGVSNYSYNNQLFDKLENTLLVSNNSFITTTDNLGNTDETNISWDLDNKSPIVKITYQEKVYSNLKKLKVKKNQNFIISVEDIGIGLKNASFFNNKHKWEPLPKTFMPLRKGRYKIRIRAEDLFGNALKTNISIKVER